MNRPRPGASGACTCPHLHLHQFRPQNALIDSLRQARGVRLPSASCTSRRGLSSPFERYDQESSVLSCWSWRKLRPPYFGTMQERKTHPGASNNSGVRQRCLGTTTGGDGCCERERKESLKSHRGPGNLLAPNLSSSDPDFPLTSQTRCESLL